MLKLIRLKSLKKCSKILILLMCTPVFTQVQGMNDEDMYMDNNASSERRFENKSSDPGSETSSSINYEEEGESIEEDVMGKIISTTNSIKEELMRKIIITTNTDIFSLFNNDETHTQNIHEKPNNFKEPFEKKRQKKDNQKNKNGYRTYANYTKTIEPMRRETSRNVRTKGYKRQNIGQNPEAEQMDQK